MTDYAIEKGAAQLAFAPDGTLVCGDSGHTGAVSVWQGVEMLRSRKCFGHNIHALAISPDGTRVALGGDEPAVRVCEVATLREVATVSVPECAGALAWTKDNRRLHILDRNKHVRLWEIGGAMTDVGLDGATHLAADAEDRVLVGAMGRLLRVRDQASGASRDIDAGMTLSVWNVAVTRDAALVAAGSLEGEVAVWDLASGELKWRDQFTSEPIEALEFSADGRMLAAGWSVEGDSSDTVVVWSVETGRPVHRWRTRGGFFADLAFHPDGTQLAACSYGRIEVWGIR